MTTENTSTLDTVGTEGESAEIVLEDLHKEFGDLVAVNDIDLTVEAGEFLVLLGPSGCGKSTTLRMIAGLESPSAGRVHIGGENVTGLHPRKRDLSMVFQSYALYPHKNVRENLAFPLEKLPMDAEERNRRIESFAELLKIDHLLDQQPKQLSGGQRQRVAVGRTIVREPSVFLMDEPLSNLDAKLRVNARSDIRDLQQRLGTTTVYVTHDQEEAMSIADRIAIMNDGEIEQVGTPEEVYEAPANEFVAGFIGEPELNFATAEVVNDGLLIDGLEADGSIAVDAPPSIERIGVRPEDIYLASATDQIPGRASRPLTTTVDLVEPQGHADELSLSCRGLTLTAWIRGGSDEVTAGETVEIVLDLEGIHQFDADGEVVG